MLGCPGTSGFPGNRGSSKPPGGRGLRGAADVDGRAVGGLSPLIGPISLGCGIAASCAAVSATSTLGSASVFSTAGSTAYSLNSHIPPGQRGVAVDCLMVR